MARDKHPKIAPKGGFGNAEIPRGFENPRSRLPDTPLSSRGKMLFYAALAVVLVAGGIMIWLAR